MGITIEEAKEILKAYDFGFTGYAGSLKDAIDSVLPIVEKYQLMQADYETRFRADMVAMLTEIQLEIEENHKEEDFMNDWSSGYNICLIDTSDLIQQKINVLKGAGEEK